MALQFCAIFALSSLIIDTSAIPPPTVSTSYSDGKTYILIALLNIMNIEGIGIIQDHAYLPEISIIAVSSL